MPLNLTPLTDLRTRILTATADEATDSILAPAVDRCPKATGALAASGKVATDADALIVYVSFGANDDSGTNGAPTNTYAVRIEEDMELRHTNGQAGFLKSSADEAQPGFAARVAGRVKR